MPELVSKSFGRLSYRDDELVHFPAGLPGFENERAFLPVERSDTKPIIFLQSQATPELFFVTVPVESIEPDYELRLLDEYRQLLEVGGADHTPGATLDLLCLAIVHIPEDRSPTANLSGPVVINRTRRIGVQAVRDDFRYSAQHPLFAEPRLDGEGGQSCS